MIILIKMPTRMINLKNRMCILIGPNHPSRNPFFGLPLGIFFLVSSDQDDTRMILDDLSFYFGSRMTPG